MKKNLFINLEIKDYVIRFVEWNAETKTIVKFGEHYISRGIISNGAIENRDEFLKIIRMLTKKWRLKRKQIRMTMPDASVIIRKQSIPSTVLEDEIQQYVSFALGESIHLPFDQPVIETLSLSTDEENPGDERDIVIISTDEELVIEYSDCFYEAGLKLVSIDISPLNYYRLLEEQELIDESDELLLIQYHVESVVFAAMENGYPIFIQQFSLFDDTTDPQSYGPTLHKEDFSRQKVMEQFDEINTEIERIQRFFRYSMNDGKKQFTKLALVGDTPFLSEIRSQLEELNDIPVIELDVEQISGPKGLEVEQRFHQALGLAMRAGI
ncbi:hypothetical protein FPQ10_06680 [Allobacillus sp. SKP2-8]|uniref:type IV pilus biogenesis protein PilM n=1 Tax=unclassified Allobacillus TaxID=2628859 RepID=UPI001182D752|nr:pilus assembly protein PilM [Allobacillus sp. SKP2-8]TSJ66937.1 hypothetical protein FPQ10_06680 [Allobacillus sp. SKP2-8]